ncbi:hypothetical protein [Alsobacter sp. R-9]
MPVSLRGVKFTSLSENSDFFNTLSIFGDGGEFLLPETPTSSVDLLFDSFSALPNSFLLSGNGSPLPSARLQLWTDNGDGLFNAAGDTQNGSDRTVGSLTWTQVVAASNNGANAIFITIDDDGNSSDGDFNDMVVKGEVAPPKEEPCHDGKDESCGHQPDCPVSEVTLTSVYEDSGFFNTLIVSGQGEEGGDIPETPYAVTLNVTFDAGDTTGGHFSLDSNGTPSSDARVKVYVDDGDHLFEPGAGDGSYLFEKPLENLTWNELATASDHGTKDLFLAIDDDGAGIDEDYNDIVVLADFKEPECHDKPCVVSEVTFTSVYEDSGFFNTFVVEGTGESGGDVQETPFGVPLAVTFDAMDGADGHFSLVSNGVISSDARVKVYIDDGDHSFEAGGDDGSALIDVDVTTLSWAKLAELSENGSKDLFLAFDDDGAGIDEDYNDIVVLADFTKPKCDDEPDCVISSGTFKSVFEDSGFFNVLEIAGTGESGGSVAETPFDLELNVNFDPTDTGTGDFRIISNGTESSNARVAIYVDNGDDLFDTATDSLWQPSKSVDDLTWADIVAATGNGESSIFLAFDDDGAGIDKDFNDIVVQFTADPCETDCCCGRDDWTHVPMPEADLLVA